MKILVLSLTSFLFFASATFVHAQDDKPDCPQISVTGPAGIAQPGDQVTYSLNFSEGKKKYDVTFHWSVSSGEIVSGQGTTSVLVKAPSFNSLTATVEIKGLPEGCPKLASEKTEWCGGLPIPVLVDEFGRLASKEFTSRIDKFWNELSNNTGSQGYIINYGTDNEIAVREQLFVKTINFRNFDRSRITLVRGGRHESGKVFTKMYRVPPGADNPTP